MLSSLWGACHHTLFQVGLQLARRSLPFGLIVTFRCFGLALFPRLSTRYYSWAPVDLDFKPSSEK